MHEKLRDHVLRAAGRLVTTHWLATLVLGVLLAGVSVVLTVRNLEFRTDRSDLVDPDLAWNHAYADYKLNYPGWDDLIVCIAGDPGDTRIDDLARRVAEALRTEPFVLAADAGFEAGEAGVRLFRAAGRAEFDQRLGELAGARRLAAATNAGQALAIATAGLQGNEAGGAERLDQLQALLAPYGAAARGETPDFSWMTGGDATRWEPFRTATGRIRIVQVRTRATTVGAAGVDRVAASLAALRAALDEIVTADPLASEVEWGVTGLTAIESDETSQSIVDSTLASILAMILITTLMIVVYRGVRLPLIAAGSLLIGIAWSFGWLMLTVGHLQLLSVVFTVILLGLGIDFALHIVARLELVQDEHADLPGAIARVFRGIGPGLATGALTTAAAFGAIALTDFRGMAEMGLIACGGILLCLVAMCSVFPAALAATGAWKRIIRHRSGGETAHFANGRLDAVDAHPRITLAATAAFLAIFGALALRGRYDPNVLNLHPPGIESVVWEKAIVAEDAHSVWAGLLPADPGELPTIVDRMRAIDQVSDVGGAGMLYPADRRERDAAVAAVRDMPIEVPDVPDGFAAVRDQLAAIRFGLAASASGLEGPARTRLQAIVAELAETLRVATRLDAAEQERRAALLEAAFAPARAGLSVMVAEALAPVPLDVGDLPAALRDRWVGADGSRLLMLHPASDSRGRSILDPERLGPFVTAMQAADPRVIGPPVQIYESSRLIIGEYFRAAIIAVAVILAILIVDFGGLALAGAGYAGRLAEAAADAACAMTPVVVGFAGAFGIMALVGEPLNFANIIVMPLIFGIGVASGVHMVHRWRVEPEGRPAGLSGGTGRGITLTSLTTMIGFGCMLVAEHRGIRSLGIVMVAGLGVTLAACYTALPALLALRARATAPTRRPAERAARRRAYIPAAAGGSGRRRHRVP